MLNFAVILFLIACAGIIFSIVQLIRNIAKKQENKKNKKILIGFTVLGIISFIMVPANSSSPSESAKTITTSSTKDNYKKPDTKSNVNKNNVSSKKNDSKLNGNLKVHYIDVGQADSILIQQGSHNMLIDAGNNADSDLVVKYLKNNGVKKLDYVIGTHPHEDHVGGLDVVINTFDIDKIYMPKVSNTTKTFKDVLTAIQSKGKKITAPSVGSTFNLGDAVCTILAPIGTGYEDLNNYSIVTKLKFGNNSFIFTGDAEDVSEGQILAKQLDIKADVLKVGHHGSSSSTTDAFLAKVNPKYAVIMCGKNNDYGHPHKETLIKLSNKNVEVYRTDEVGTITAISDGNKITFSTKPGSYNSKGSNGNTQTDTVVPTKPVVKNSKSNVVKKNNTTSKKIQKKPRVSKPVKKSRQVWLSATGDKYHSIPNCGRMNPNRATKVSIEEAKQGHDACSKCM